MRGRIEANLITKARDKQRSEVQRASLKSESDPKHRERLVVPAQPNNFPNANMRTNNIWINNQDYKNTLT